MANVCCKCIGGECSLVEASLKEPLLFQQLAHSLCGKLIKNAYACRTTFYLYRMIRYSMHKWRPTSLSPEVKWMSSHKLLNVCLHTTRDIQHFSMVPVIVPTYNKSSTRTDSSSRQEFAYMAQLEASYPPVLGMC